MRPRVRLTTPRLVPRTGRVRARDLARSVSGLLLVAALAACSAVRGVDPLIGAGPAASCVTAQASSAPVELAPTLVPGLSVDSWADEGAHAELSTPVLPGLALLNDQLRLAASQALQRYRGLLADRTVTGELNVSWTLVGVSERSVGVLLRTQQTVGSRQSSSEQAFWLERAGQRLLQPVDLLTAPGWSALQKHVTRDLCVGSSDRASAIASVLAGPGGDGASVTFGYDGNLVVAATPGPDARPLSVVVDARTAASWLSSPGQAALAAATHPQRLLMIGPRPPTPPPEPSQLTQRAQAARQARAARQTQALRLAKARTARAERAQSRAKVHPTHARNKRPRKVDCRKARCVALTFDDGPGPYTSQLVAELRRAKAPATFFMIGAHVAAMPAAAREVAAAGFEIGNHSWSHPDLTRRSSTEVADQLSRTSAAIRRATGRAPRLMRPPYGARNARVDQVVRRQGLAQVLWSVDTLDWKHRNVHAVQDAVRHRVRRGSIVLLHDIHPTTVEAIPGIIAQLRHDGYTLVTVSQLLGPLAPGARRFGVG